MTVDTNSAALQTQANGAGSEILNGSIKRIIYRSVDGYNVYAASAGIKSEFTMQYSGAPFLEEGEAFEALGRWGSYKGKPTFIVSVLSLIVPETPNGIARWLKHRAISGVGQARIKSLIEHHGLNLINVMDDPAALALTPKISADQANDIANAWRSNVGQPVIYQELSQFGALNAAQTKSIIDRFGAASFNVVQDNPWRLADEVAKISFETSDKIAKQLGLALSSPKRILAGMNHILSSNLQTNGHCALPRLLLINETARLLNLQPSQVAEEFAGACEDKRSNFHYVESSDLVYDPECHQSEKSLTKGLLAILKHGKRVELQKAEAAITQSQDLMGITLDEDQRNAAILALTSPLVIITGRPGTGKSTTQRVIVDAMGRLGLKIALTAPTGRAAQRLSEVTGCEAGTCHRLLEYSAEFGGFTRDETNPLPQDQIVADEFSMVDINIAASLTAAIKKGSRLLLVGDVDQLESVGPGQVLRDLIKSGLIPIAELTTIHRQAQDSGIIIASNRIRSGENIIKVGERLKGFYVSVPMDDFEPEQINSRVVDLVATRLTKAGFDPLNDIQVIAPYRKGALGVNELNRTLKAAINPATEGHSITLNDRTFSIGDKVLQLKNDYAKSVFNGDVGVVTSIETDVASVGNVNAHMTVDFNGTAIKYNYQNVRDIELAWATTVHKAQGCEYPVVVIVVPQAPRILLTRNLIYTAVTRAKKECILIGSRSSMLYAISNVQTDRRHGDLIGQLTRGYNEVFHTRDLFDPV